MKKSNKVIVVALFGALTPMLMWFLWDFMGRDDSGIVPMALAGILMVAVCIGVIGFIIHYDEEQPNK